MVIVSAGVLGGWTIGWIRHQRRTAVTLDRDDFGRIRTALVTMGGRVTSFKPEQALSLASRVKPILRNGTFTGWSAQHTVELEERSGSLRFRYRSAAATVDPLAALWLELETTLDRRVEDRLNAGREISGKGWTLTRERLTAGENSTAIADLKLIRDDASGLRVWRGMEDRPFWTLAVDAPNRASIGNWLIDRVPAIEPDHVSESDIPGGGLGRVLFERSPSLPITVLMIVSGVLMAVIGLMMIWIDPVAAGIFLGIAALAPVGVILARQTRFTVRTLGVESRTPFSHRQVRDVEIDRFLYRTRAMYHNGAYIGTVTTLGFVPDPATGVRRFRWSGSSQGEDPELVRLRDRISQAVARRMLAEFEETGRLEWTPGMILDREGITFRALGVLARGAPTRVTWDEVTGGDSDGERFRLRLGADSVGVATVSEHEENFHPGVIAFELLLRRRDRA